MTLFQWLLAIASPLILLLLYRGSRMYVFGLVRALFRRRAASPAAPVAGKGGFVSRNWIKLILLGILGLFVIEVGSCMKAAIDLPRKIAQEGREFERDMGQAWDKFTSPAEQPELEELEEKLPPSPLSVMQMTDWWKKHGRPDRQDGWKSMGTEVGFHANGELGLAPVINTTFWEGYELEINPLYNMEYLGSPFTSHILAGLVDSNEDDQLLQLGGSRTCRMPIHQQTGLVWLRTRSSSRYGVPEPSKGFGFTAQVVEPGNNPYLVQRKQGSVRFAYWRDFRPVPGKSEVSPCVTLPFQVEAAGLEKPVRVDFDLDIILARLPKPGESTVKVPRPNVQDLQMGAVKMELVCGKKALEFILGEWHTRLSSENDIRPLLSDPDDCSHARLEFTCGMPVAVHVAIQIGGTRR